MATANWGTWCIKKSRLINPVTSSFRTCNKQQLRCKHSTIRVSSMLANLHGPSSASHDNKAGCKSARLMLTGGIIQGAANGTYHLLPLAVRALEKLHRIIDLHMQSIGAQKVSLPTLTPGALWRKTGRWDTMGPELLKVSDRHGVDYCFSPTHEEAVTSVMVAQAPLSYKLLPVRLYQITRKFRDEMRPKNGLLRSREFEMKDLYSFDTDEEKAKESYDAVCGAYHQILDSLGLHYVKVQASVGTIGGSFSHEYHLPSQEGEDTLQICSKCGRSFNLEVADKHGSYTEHCGNTDCSHHLETLTGIEIAHTFLLGTKYSSALKATYRDSNKKNIPLQMGCFGIGVTRLLAAGIEVLSLDTEMRWPRLLAPHQVCIIPQKEGYKCEVTNAMAEMLYEKASILPNLTSEVVLDDRLQLSIGKRLYWAKQMGFPVVITLGKQALEDIPKYEYVDVYAGTSEHLLEDQVIQRLSKIDTVL